MDEQGSTSVSAVQGQHGLGQPPEGDYLTLQELATWLKMSRGSVWSLVMEKGGIPYYRFGDRVVRLSRADVEAYLARCRSDAL